MEKNNMIGEWIVFLTSMLFTYILIEYCISKTSRLIILGIILKLLKERNPQVDGSRIFITGNTYMRKLLLKAEQLYEEQIDVTPAGVYISYANEMLITKFALEVNNEIDTYGTLESMKKLVGVISHEFMHMLLTLEHYGGKESLLFDNLSSYADSLDLNGMEDRHA